MWFATEHFNLSASVVTVINCEKKATVYTNVNGDVVSNIHQKRRKITKDVIPQQHVVKCQCAAKELCFENGSKKGIEIEQGLTSHQTHYRSYWGRVFTGQMT